MDTIYEVHSHKPGKKPVNIPTSYDKDDAIRDAVRLSKENTQASLVTVNISDDSEIEIEVFQEIYTNGVVSGSSKLNKVRTKMETQSDTGIEIDKSAVNEAYKAQMKADKEAKKAEKAAAREALKAQRAADKEARKAERAAGVVKGPRSKFADEATIVFTDKGQPNPKQKNSKSFGWYAAYVEGMTVAAYREAIGKGQANSCLDWDVKHGFIIVE